MTYKETIDYLYQHLPMFSRIGAAAFKKDLTNTQKLCDFHGLDRRLYHGGGRILALGLAVDR